MARAERMHDRPKKNCHGLHLILMLIEFSFNSVQVVRTCALPCIEVGVKRNSKNKYWKLVLLAGDITKIYTNLSTGALECMHIPWQSLKHC